MLFSWGGMDAKVAIILEGMMMPVLRSAHATSNFDVADVKKKS